MRFKSFVMAIFAVLAGAGVVYAAVAVLDPSFDTDGYVLFDGTQPPLEGADRFFDFEAIVRQSDGKLLLLASGIDDINIVRLNSNGSVDATYGVGGEVALAPLMVPGGAESLALDPAGRLLVMTGQALVRLNTNGTLDATFGGDGIVTLADLGFDLNTDNIEGRPVLDVDGGSHSILVIGSADDGMGPEAFVARITSTGVLDNAFGTNGIVRFADAEAPIFVDDKLIAIDSLDRIVYTYARFIDDGTGLVVDTVAGRMSDDGLQDGAFNTTVQATIDAQTPAGSNIEVADIAIQTGNRILVAGEVEDSDSVFLVRIAENGNLDTSFGVNGAADLGDPAEGALETAAERLVLDSGNIYFLLERDVGGASDENVLAVFSENGQLSNTFFSSDGFAVFDPDIFNNPEIAEVSLEDFLVQPDGRIALAGVAFDDMFGADPLVLRMLPSETMAPGGGGGEGSGGGGGGGCFIATAAFGSYLHPHVQSLRDFRDRHLLTNAPGRMFVNFYYTYSPPVASIIAQNEVLKAATRVVLTPVVAAVKYPLPTFGMLALVALGLMAACRRREAPIGT